MEQPRKCSHVGFWVSIALLAALVLLSLLANAGLFAALVARSGGAAGKSVGGEDEFPQLTEKWSYGSGDVKAVRIAVEGVIFRENGEGLFGPRYDKIEAILRQVRAAQGDD